MRAFFFAPESVLPLARVRIALAVVLLWEAGWQWPYAVELWSTAGPALPVFLQSEIVPGSALEEDGRFPRRFVGYFHPPTPTPGMAIVLGTLRVFALACVAVGWRTRTSLVLAFAASLYLGLLDGTNFAKYSVLGLHVLGLLAFSRCGAALSIDSLNERAGASPRFLAGAAHTQASPEEQPGASAHPLSVVGTQTACPLHPAWLRRLIQLTVCHMYLGAALTKLRLPDFFTGDLLTFSLLDDAWGGGWPGHWVATRHNLVVVLSLVTVLVELLFPFLVWVRRARPWVLLAAAVLHVGMGLLLHVGIFPMVMLAVLLAFVDEPMWRRLWRGWPRLERSEAPERGARRNVERRAPGFRSAPTPATLGVVGYLLVLTAALAAGFAIQWFHDDYGAFGGRELPLPERLTPAAVDEMFFPARPTPEHYVLHVALGSRVNGNQVFGDARRFQVGERVFVVVRFLRSHPPLKVEGLLVSPSGEEVARFTRRAAEDIPYITGGFELIGPLDAGSYLVVIQVDGFETARRTIEVH